MEETTKPQATTERPASGEAAPIIRFRGVHKSFGDKVILDGLDLDVPEGQTLVIMGPSGTGKSVTLRHVIGLMQPDQGQVEVWGKDVNQIARKELVALRKRIGYLFQDGALINWLNVGDNVALPLRENSKLDEAEIREKVEHKLELVHLPGIWDRMPGELSGGMRKRVGLARALITDAELILYDEPNAGLDPEMSGSINQLIAEIADTLGITSVVVTHLQSCVRVVADRVVLLEKGRLVVDLPRDEFLASKHPRVRSFLGDDPD
ncbi:ABC transporter ATP-binding protein [Engelhardtia mirabilis]|uniref:Putative phospholipid import ATP-binding protein MlaF n=1 Tax=Engelhardtia mirabilis TaxID=2528011 RepID=A0A518BPH1_9BACT|nr:putative phospholipid import ATP-binding protein MlaF [Planctomycetes bacterium Pla133]QDV03195.1 putative phospholipid import ATP-binding protein MlaF [Planctomycetes bacterium Pla86]